MLINNGNLFKFNTADDGGALIWTKDRPIIGENVTFLDNAADYGKNIASYPKSIKMEFLSNNDYVNPYNKTSATTTLRLLQSSNTKDSNQTLGDDVPPLVSGNTIDFNIYILDQEGNLYSTDSTSKAVIDSD